MSENSRQSRGLERIGIAVPAHVNERLKQITGYLKVPQSTLIEAIVSTMTMPELKRAIDAALELRELEKVLHRKSSAQMLNLVRGKSADQIRQMAIAANQHMDEE